MRELNDWFLENRREFPWRIDPSPYKVWISEVMLQQTRASVVVPYFERWMDLFPDVAALASSELEKVIKAWEGLGYYSRARNLHEGARQIMQLFGGNIPSSREGLEKIRGIGPYTLGAILSFGFKKRAAAVDGNVTRVLARHFLIEENVCKQAVKKKIFEHAEAMLDLEKPWVSAEALIELGATVCTPVKPKCTICPLQKSCLGQKKAELLPIKNKETETIHLKRIVILLEAEGKVLIKKGEKGKVMEGLYEFPYFEMTGDVWNRDKIERHVEKSFGLKVHVIEKLPRVAHTFTKYKADLTPFRLQSNRLQEVKGYLWVDRQQLEELPFSSGHRRILAR
jgi:A/G-specific adenine glycosylase